MYETKQAVQLLIPTSVWDQSRIRKFLYKPLRLRGDAPSFKVRNAVEDEQASGPTFDPNIRLGPKLDQNVPLHVLRGDAQRKWARLGV
eukprot:scaffold55661_cov46-Attheya_sp.AAC.1